MTSNWKIREFIGEEGLRQLKSDWYSLLDEMVGAGFQHEYETHRAYYSNFGAVGDSCRFLVLMDGSRVRAICPVEQMLKPVFLGSTSTWTLGNSRTHGIFLDVICPSNKAKQVLIPQILRYLAEIPSGAHWLIYDHVLEGSVLWDCLMSANKTTYCIERTGATDVLNCDRSFELLVQENSKSHNRSLRKARRRSGKNGVLSHRRSVTPHELTHAFEVFVELEASGKKGEYGNRGALCYKPDQLAFYRDLVAAFGMLGRCEIHTLELENRYVAAEICFQTGAELASLKICYSEDDARIAPGLLLLDSVVERCCTDPDILRFNLISHQHWHQGWRPEIIPAYTVYIPLHRLRGPLLVWLLHLRLNYAPKLGRLLRWLRLKR